MKTVKLTVLFKSGVEKSYYESCDNNEEINNIYVNFRRYIGSNKYPNMEFGNAFIILSEVVSAEIEVLE